MAIGNKGMEKRKSSPQDAEEPFPLASLASEAAIRPNIRALFSDGKEDTSERPEDISGKEAETSLGPIGY